MEVYLGLSQTSKMELFAKITDYVTPEFRLENPMLIKVAKTHQKLIKPLFDLSICLSKLMILTVMGTLSAKYGKLYVGRVHLSLNKKYRGITKDKMS